MDKIKYLLRNWDLLIHQSPVFFLLKRIKLLDWNQI